jgi:hypothetical protein
MVNAINSGSLETLTPGQTLLLAARKVEGNKTQLEFAEILQQEDRPVNALAMFNQSDPRFSAGGKPRRAWMSVQAEDAEVLLGVDLTTDFSTNEMGHVVKSLNILNPEVDGQRLRPQIVETTEATQWQAENIHKAAKRKGKDGDFITHKGMHIFTQSTVVIGEPTNVFLDADVAVSNAGILANGSVSVNTGEIFS